MVAAGFVLQQAGAATFEWKAIWGIFPDQLTNGMALFNGSTPEFPVLTNNVLAITNDQSAEALFYRMDPTNVLIPPNLIIEAEMRFTGGQTDEDSRAGSVILFTTTTNVGNALQVRQGQIFIGSGHATRGPTAAVDTANFHLYRIEVDGTNQTSVVRVYQDGALRLTGSLYEDAPDHGSATRVIFGEASVLAYGGSEWKSFKHNAALAPSSYPPSLSIECCSPLTLHGLVTKTYRVEAVADLVSTNWSPVTNVTLAAPAFTFIDAGASGLSKRFYRAVELP